MIVRFGAGRPLFCARVVLALALSAIAGPALAQTVTYTVNQTIGNGSVKGTIITSGRQGTLGSADILSWNLIVQGGSASTVLTSTGGQSAFLLVGPDVTANGNKLYFNYGAANQGYLVFQASNPGFYSGQKYWCNNSNWFGCGLGASAVPESYNSASAQYDTSYNALTVIGVGGPTLSDDALLASLLSLVRARFAQLLVNELFVDELLGQNEQVSCGNCASAGFVFGSQAFTLHGRQSLTRDLTLFGGVNVGAYRQSGADVTLNAVAAAKLQFDPYRMGPSRPYASVGVSVGYQKVGYRRDYTTSSGPVIAGGGSEGYNVGVSADVGWVARLTPRDEAGVDVGYAHNVQMMHGYSEAAGGDRSRPSSPAATTWLTACRPLRALPTWSATGWSSG